MHLINIRRMAYGVDDLGIQPEEAKMIDRIDIEQITKLVLEQLKNY